VPTLNVWVLRIDRGVAVGGDLDLVVEPNRLRRNPLVELFNQEVRAFGLRDVRRQEVFARGRHQVITNESSAAVGGDPAEGMQPVVMDGAVACGHPVGFSQSRQRAEEAGVGGDVAGESQRSGGAGAHRTK